MPNIIRVVCAAFCSPPRSSSAPGDISSLDAIELEARVLYNASPFPVDLVETLDGLPNDLEDALTGLTDNIHSTEPTIAERISELSTLATHSLGETVESLSTVELVFVDRAVENADELLRGLVSDSEHHRNFVVVELNNGQDGVQQITDALGSHSKVDAIHIISHGSSGQVQLGDTLLAAHTLDGYHDQISQWKDSLDEGADLFFYGCDLASDSQGRSFLETLGALCDCDIAASDDTTGHSSLGGDWDLEFQLGEVNTQQAFSYSVQASWAGLLTLSAADEALVHTASTDSEETSAENRGSQKAVAVDSAGNQIVVWSDDARDGNGWGVWGQRFAADGSKVGSEFQINTNNTGNERFATVAMDSTGRFVVAFSANDGDESGIYLRRFEADGTAIDSSDILVNSGQTAGKQYNASIAANASGQMVISWQSDGASEGIFARQFDMTSTAVGNALSTTLITVESAAAADESSVDINDTGRFVVVWEQGGDLYGRRYDFGSSTALSARHDLNFAGSGERQVVVGVQSDDDFVIAYRSDILFFNGIWTRHFQADGSAYSASTKVSSGNDGIDPSISMTASDGFVLVYEDSDADGTGIFARKYDSDRTAQGVRFQVNTSTSLDQQNASVAAMDLDNFTVVWSGNGDQTGQVDTDGVFYRQYGTGPVANAPPTDITPNTFSINENVDTSGGVSLGQLTTTDADVVETFTYTVLSGADGALFSIGGTGNDELILDDGVLDFETTDSYTVNVRVTDSTTNTYDETLTVNVNDINEAPSIALTPAVTNLDEDADTLSAITVANIVVTDDGLGTESLTLSGADAALFEIVAGDLRLRSGVVLDFETNGSLDVTVNVDDATIVGNPDDFANHSITVNDINEAPSIALTPVVTNLDEDADTSSAITVANIVVTDDGLGSESLTLSGADAALFEIVAGDLQLRSGVVLDFETNGSLDVTVNVDDATIVGNPDDFANHSITVNDINEAPSIALTPVVTNLDEDADTLSAITVANIVVTDDGLGTESLTLSGADAALFEIVAGDLRLRSGVALDFETNGSLDVTVNVDDATIAGNPDDFANYSVMVDNVNEAPFDIAPNSSTLASGTDTTGGVSIATLIASDPDSGETFTFGILPGADGSLFSIGGIANDELSIDDGLLDFSRRNSYTVNLEVTDSGGNSYQEVFTISVPTPNLAPTDITLSSSTINENLDTSGGVSIGLLSATDPDAPETFAYSILPGGDWARFSLGGVGNELVLNDGVLDYEKQATYSVVVEVTDSSSNTYSETIIVNVVDVDESPIAKDDRYSVVSGVRMKSDSSILANDIDPEMDVMVPVILAQASHGSVLLNGDGSFTYLADADFVGVDSFTYQVSDGGSAPSQATVSIEVLAPPLPVRTISDPDSGENRNESTEDDEGGIPEFVPPIDRSNSTDSNLTSSPRPTQTSNPFADLEENESELKTLVLEENLNRYTDFLYSSVASNGASDSTETLEVRSVTLPTASTFTVSAFALESFDALRDEVASEHRFGKAMVGTTMVATTSLSVGYVIWLVRGGVLLSSVLSSLPAWRMVDPLPVLGYLDSDNDGGDDDSLENLVNKSNKNAPVVHDPKPEVQP